MDTRGAVRVLVVEDNSALANVLKFNLERSGFDVRIARNGREAWELLEITCPDMVISDHQMPELTGVELCRLMRNDERWKNTPFVLVTAKRLEIDVERICSELNIAQTFSKPFSPAAIISAVRDELSLARQIVTR